MTKEISNKFSSNHKKNNHKGVSKLDKKINHQSDSDSSEEYEDEDDFISENDDEMDSNEFRKYLQKIFPSKYMADKIKTNSKQNSTKKKIIVETDTDDDDEINSDTNSINTKTDGNYKNTSKKNKYNTRSKNSKNQKPYNKQKKEANKSKYYSESSEYEDDDSDDDAEEQPIKNKKTSKFNIVFTIGDLNEDYNSEDDEDYNTDDAENENEDEDEDISVSTVSEEEEDSEESITSDEEDDKYKNKNKLKSTKKNENNMIKTENKTNNINYENNKILEKLEELKKINPDDKSVQKCIQIYEKELQNEAKLNEKKSKKQKAKNVRIFKKIINDENCMNDYQFYGKMDIEKQKHFIKEMREINKITKVEKPYRMKVLESSIPLEFKAAVMKKINLLKNMQNDNSEFYKIKNWVNTFMKIPFMEYKKLPVNINDGIDKCHEFMETAKNILNDAVYGLDDAKMQIMQMVGQLLTNPESVGTSIAIHGPPGTGKTSLVKEGISKILNRPFAFIALGGATDSSFLEGHGYTYEGSTWGKIVQILIDSKCMNPVIYFDELDKISDTAKGEEIVGILTHLTDTSQNSQFHDKYFSEIDFDLSKCLFIFSYNDESKVNPILRDRMYRIKTKGYSGKEKLNISNNYLLPKIREEIRFNKEDIIIPDEVISYINENYCNGEQGVRNIKRCLEIIYSKLNLYRLMKPDTNLFEKDMSIKVEFPYTVTKDIVDKLIKKDTDGLETWRKLYV